MPRSLLDTLNGKPPQMCIDQLYSAIYVCTRQFILNGFPLDQALSVLDKKNKLMVEELHSELKGFYYVLE